MIDETDKWPNSKHKETSNPLDNKYKKSSANVMFEYTIIYFPLGRIYDSDAADSTVTSTDDDVTDDELLVEQYHLGNSYATGSFNEENFVQHLTSCRRKLAGKRLWPHPLNTCWDIKSISNKQLKTL